jgi:hypothetical protein
MSPRFCSIWVGSRRSPPSKGVANWRTDLFAGVRHYARRTGKLSIFNGIEPRITMRSPVRHCKRRTHPKTREWRTEMISLRGCHRPSRDQNRWAFQPRNEVAGCSFQAQLGSFHLGRHCPKTPARSSARDPDQWLSIQSHSW